MTTEPPLAIEMRAVDKWFGDFQVLKDINLTVSRGERVVICGPSGSGKSTVVRCVNRLEVHQKGVIRVEGVELKDDRASIDAIRSEVGMVFQQFNLFPHLTVMENLTLGPMKSRGMARSKAEELAMRYLERVRIPEQADKKPGQLSGGQQQRVAVARALASQPDIVFGDEPTGNLDSRTGAEILTFMRSAVDDLGQTIVMVTHDPVSASYADRVLFLADGLIVDELLEPDADTIYDRMRHLGD